MGQESFGRGTTAGKWVTSGLWIKGGRRMINVLVVDDHRLFRQGLHALMGRAHDIHIIGEARDGQEAVDLAEELRPDVILMDLEMPHMGGIQAIRAIRARQPEARILVLTSFSEDENVFPAIEAGALGYMLKDTNSATLLQAIRLVARNEPSLDTKIQSKLMKGYTHTQEKKEVSEALSPREKEVLILLAGGLNNQAIADRLKISELTVRSHVSSVLDKLNLANRVQAALYALRQGMVKLE
jgi:two-component system, NarL family, response regulator LiaR